jgi:hypothetical protein
MRREAQGFLIRHALLPARGRLTAHHTRFKPALVAGAFLAAF